MITELAGLINREFGGKTPDQTLLDDLYYWNINAGIARGDSPPEWLTLLKNLDKEDRRCVILAIGNIERMFLRNNNTDPDLGDVRRLTIENMMEMGVSKNNARFIYEAFKHEE